MDIRGIVAGKLRSMKGTPETIALWDEIAATFEAAGPDGVEELITDRVKEARKRAAREAKEMTDVAGVVAKPKKKRKK